MSNNILIDYINKSMDDKIGTNLVDSLATMNDIMLKMEDQYNELIDQLNQLQDIIDKFKKSDVSSQLDDYDLQITELDGEVEVVTIAIDQLKNDQATLDSYLQQIDEQLSYVESNTNLLNAKIKQLATVQGSVGNLMAYPS